jgi:DNA gyrase subunit A
MHSTLLFFTASGKCYWLKVYQVPEGSRASKGRAIQNVLSIPDDKIKAIINVKTLADEEYINNNFVILVTKRGLVKKTTLEAYSRPRAKGINAVTFREGDELLAAMLTNGHEEIFLASSSGLCCRFSEETVRPMGRMASGVRGINIAEDEEVVSAISYDPNAEDANQHTLLVVSEKGYGKRSEFDLYRKTNRGGKGVRTINITDKTGKLVAMGNVTMDEDLMIINRSGVIIRMEVKKISETGRNAQGVKLITIREEDSIAAVSVVPGSEEENQEAEAPQAPTQGSPEPATGEEGQENN